MRQLPFLNGVRAFESAARLGGFSRAADELNVTPAAISRMVKLLEERLGFALFERTPNGLTLTEAGADYQPGLTRLLDDLAALTERTRADDAARKQARSSGRTLTVGVGPTFAIRWLIPRLAAFQQACPDIDVHIATGGAAAPYSDDWSCGISLGNGDWPGLVTEPLFAADLTPVCTPALAATLGTFADLDHANLLRVAHSPDDWPLWLGAAAANQVRADGPELGFYGQALQAAIDGVGVAMGIRPYIDDDLAAGRLVAPFDLSVPKGGHWYLVYQQTRAGDPAFGAFRDWIADQAVNAGATRTTP